MGFFGGVLEYNKMGYMARKAMEVGYKSQLEKTGFKETASSGYDLRNWDEIRRLTWELSQKAIMNDGDRT